MTEWDDGGIDAALDRVDAEQRAKAIPWASNHALFKQQLAIGHRHAEYVGDTLKSRGLSVEVTPMEVRDHIAERDAWSDEWDISVGSKRLEVKSRDLPFTGPSDFPYSTAFVYAKDGWQRKTHKPHAIVLVSQRTGGLAVIPVSTEPQWQVTRPFDRKRQHRYEALEVDRRLLASFDRLVAWLRGGG